MVKMLELSLIFILFPYYHNIFVGHLLIRYLRPQYTSLFIQREGDSIVVKTYNIGGNFFSILLDRWIDGCNLTAVEC